MVVVKILPEDLFKKGAISRFMDDVFFTIKHHDHVYPLPMHDAKQLLLGHSAANGVDWKVLLGSTAATNQQCTQYQNTL